MMRPLYDIIRQTYISQYCIERSPVNFVYMLSSKSETVIKRPAMYSNYTKNLWGFLKLFIFHQADLTREQMYKLYVPRAHGVYLLSK